MEYYVDSKASGRARCNSCGEKISKGNIVMYSWATYRWKSYKVYYCKKCSTEILRGSMDRYRKYMKELGGSKRVCNYAKVIEV
jgi:hypothetical protein